MEEKNIERDNVNNNMYSNQFNNNNPSSQKVSNVNNIWPEAQFESAPNPADLVRNDIAMQNSEQLNNDAQISAPTSNSNIQDNFNSTISQDDSVKTFLETTNNLMQNMNSNENIQQPQLNENSNIVEEKKDKKNNDNGYKEKSSNVLIIVIFILLALVIIFLPQISNFI